MTTLNFTAFNRQGNTDNDEVLETNEEVIKTSYKLCQSALATIKIFTPDLENQIYNQDKLREILIKFCRANRHAQVHILANDTSQAMQQGHHLIRLAQQITSHIQIRITSLDYLDIPISFLLIDRSEFVFKADYQQSNAIHSHCQPRANKLHETFNYLWELADEDINSKNLHL